MYAERRFVTSSPPLNKGILVQIKNAFNSWWQRLRQFVISKIRCRIKIMPNRPPCVPMIAKVTRQEKRLCQIAMLDWQE
jgi:hypothetical protein